MAMFLLGSIANAQSVEAYLGHKRAGVDLMWFKNVKNAQEQRTPFLFFSRTRSSTDYDNSPTAFGSTNAISYNFKNGLGLVVVGSFLNAGFTPKTGLQWVKMKDNFLFFGWLVADLTEKGSIETFGLFRYQPKINKKWKGFGQAELFPVYNPTTKTWNLTQRLRLGAKHRAWAVGLMMDLNQTGRDRLTQTNNWGGFLRYDF
ncbi:MAG TPA: hypothetical protein PLO56_10280 [Rhodothermales bacterium]|nr:hypothetical protein [Rhodothermales bacterium]